MGGQGEQSGWKVGGLDRVGAFGGGALDDVSLTHGVEIPHPNLSPWGRGAKTLMLRLLPLAQFGRGGWGVRVMELTLDGGALGVEVP